MPALTVVEPADPPLSPARRELARAIEWLADARRAVEAAAAPERRLAGIVANLETVEAELAALRAEDDRRLAAWLVSGQGDRPQPSEATLDCERRLIEARRDGDAARQALAGAQAAVQGAAERNRDAITRRDAAIIAVAVETARGFADSRFREALNTAIAMQSKLEAVRLTLLAIDGQPKAGQAAATIGEIIKEARSGAVAECDHQAAKRLLTALERDPAAVLE
jgi:hypothetical protein